MAEERRRSTRAKPAASEARRLEPHRVFEDSGRGRIPVFLGVTVLAAAAAVALVLIVSGSNEDNMSFDTGTTPTAVALTPNQTGKSQAKARAATAAKPAARKTSCAPIVGGGTQNGGKTYAVSSSATDGDPANCGVALSVLRSALTGRGNTIGGWHCTTQPSATTIASCTSVGGRRVQARG
jgi:hypothetical protein